MSAEVPNWSYAAAPPAALRRASDGAVGNGHLDAVELDVSTAGADPAWDAFVASVPGASYLQTSLWSQVKAAAGIRVLRVILRRGDAIVAGCQMLVRRAPIIGAVGYVPLGPVIAPDAPDLTGALLERLEDVARGERVAYVKLQPATWSSGLEAALSDAGYVPSDLAVAPTSTVRIRVAGRSDDDLLKAMRASTRGNLRRGEKSSVRIETVGEADLPVLQEHLEATARRQGFTPYPASYNRRLWETFRGGADARLLVARDGDEALASAMLIGFGETVIHKVGGWSGKPSKVRPNELIHWTAMRWARDAGYAHYDLGGISPDAVRALREQGEAARSDPKNGVAFFKLGLGGEIVEGPGAFDRPMPTLRGRAVAGLAPRLQRRRETIARLAGRSR